MSTSEILTFTSSLLWTFTGSNINSRADGSVTAAVYCWGAGGSGNKSGGGGSGGAFSSDMVNIKPGTYRITVGTASLVDGGDSVFFSGNHISVLAAGGRGDGTVSHQAEQSIGKFVRIGGKGGPAMTGYGTNNGSGGGGAGGADGNGFDGQSGLYSTGITPASGGKYNNSGVEKFGGDGAYYHAGTSNNRIVNATVGDVPGCGGGGCHSTLPESFSIGGNGVVQIWMDSSFS